MSTERKGDEGQETQSECNVVAFLPTARMAANPEEQPFTGAERAALRQLIARQERIIKALTQFESVTRLCPMALKIL